MKNQASSNLLFISAWVAVLATGFCVKADAATNNLYLATPGSSWSLEIDASGFTLQQKDLSQDGTAARLMAENKSNGVILSAFLEKAAGPGDAKACREYYWKDAQKSPFKKDDIEMSEAGSVALVEYLVKEHLGIRVNQKNLNAYLSHNGYWVDVHISMADFKSGDEATLQSIVKSIRFNDSYTPTTIEWATWGSFFMSKKKYAEAVRCDEKAWEAERSQPTLSRQEQVFLLSDLIDAYGNSGNIRKAKEFSELGLQREPAYPKFYYDLACCYAGSGDKVQALANLKAAFQNKSKLFSEDTLPDPTTDSSFSKYSTDPDFVKFFSGLGK